MSAPATSTPLLTTPLNALHIELGARMVPFAGYSMPVQYPAGLMAEHHHTRKAAGLFDVSHMGQLRWSADAAAAFETLMPVDVIDLPVGKQRYGLLLNDEGDHRRPDVLPRGAGQLFVIVNGACKVGDIAHIQARIGQRCQVIPLPDHALLALQGPQAATALARLAPGVDKLVFMTGGNFQIAGCDCFVTRSGYTGEDGFEISVPAAQADTLARALLAQPGVLPIGLGARNSLRLEAGLCLYGNDIDTTTTPGAAQLGHQKVRRTSAARGGFRCRQGVARSTTRQPAPACGPVAERAGARAHRTAEHGGPKIGGHHSGPHGERRDMGYVTPALRHRHPCQRHVAVVPMEVRAMPFVATTTRLIFAKRETAPACCRSFAFPLRSFPYDQIPNHNWIAPLVGRRVGITIADALGDVFVACRWAKRPGEVAGVVESVKAAADVMPSPAVVEVSEALRADPSLVIQLLSAGWFFEKLADVSSDA